MAGAGEHTGDVVQPAADAELLEREAVERVHFRQQRAKPGERREVVHVAGTNAVLFEQRPVQGLVHGGPLELGERRPLGGSGVQHGRLPKRRHCQLPARPAMARPGSW